MTFSTISPSIRDASWMMVEGSEVYSRCGILRPRTISISSQKGRSLSGGPEYHLYTCHYSHYYYFNTEQFLHWTQNKPQEYAWKFSWTFSSWFIILSYRFWLISTKDARDYYFVSKATVAHTVNPAHNRLREDCRKFKASYRVNSRLACFIVWNLLSKKIHILRYFLQIHHA